MTGGSRGIGAAIALALAADGAEVLINFTSESSKSKAEDIVTKIQKLGSKGHVCRADVGATDIGETLVKACKEIWGNDFVLHMLVQNAGVSINETLEESQLETYTKTFDINVRGPMLITKALLPHIKKGGGGRIVLLSSVSAMMGFPKQTVYGASKAAIEHFARCWTNEFGKEHDINITCVNPGPITSDMWDSTTEEFKESVKKSGAPIGEPEDIADVVAFLCSDKARWVNGSTINTNKGLYMN